MQVISDKATVVLAAGGTGGHLFPAQGTCEQLIADSYVPVLVHDQRATRFISGVLSGVDKYEVRSLNMSGSKLQRLLLMPIYLLQTLYNTLLVIFILKNCKAALVIAFGGYTAVPTILAALVSGIPCILHEQNAVVGRVNRYFAYFVKAIATPLPNEHMDPKFVQKFKNKLHYIGNPVRDKVSAQFYASKMKSRSKFKILVIGGSQGAQIFSSVMPEAISELPIDTQRIVHITQQVRQGTAEATIASYSQTASTFEVASYFDNIGELYAAHDIVISRAGASTIAELCTFGCPAILVPYPFATDDHQYYNALYLSKYNCSVLINQRDFTPQRVADEILKMILTPDYLDKMREGFDGIEKIDTTQKLRLLVESIMKPEVK
ncbi:UDP-N-acetylglucosamine--N-acetylmuramyl-(pentapeptide) pyrophosphoryl-undecaprenol N-acetylglucosamine transferase [Rickettsiales endosymbiont of Peranema trichophorum]|uniref:UDP-N-acetylglucosamine--N-acetylmuramyl- (pentapeptide) pyrophosphoryl-undecaprenol N-acetylglucosamine transferase n=1 Tax=Rickettsiales endosymbiont of Peranema trichophorum TaxID=2486577 RepID=UPI001023BA36|nr:UDP-N-acetylglucosamine--N-acetylmuramyl-(pentapeptide) pyrophosphoryl-undecaprenol N-acetylglucosamine transferase [Rickettsiales endosymbiont of Peranema trichophorum]RZI46978.1 UDP-N-acetylglucosamine--N-acetylmuramyl-(pentapeptide) pyrophosphoryl-undecaprenol N-acetylglucosamine transferase [Rickettsiales endosymbiont of Peranema trichophorum]